MEEITESTLNDNPTYVIYKSLSDDLKLHFRNEYLKRIVWTAMTREIFIDKRSIDCLVSITRGDMDEKAKEEAWKAYNDLQHCERVFNGSNKDIIIYVVETNIAEAIWVNSRSVMTERPFPDKLFWEIVGVIDNYMGSHGGWIRTKLQNLREQSSPQDCVNQ